MKTIAILLNLLVLIIVVQAKQNSLKCIDTSLSGINIDDPASTMKVMGSSVETNHDEDFPSFSFRNKSGDQIGTLVFLPGGEKDGFSQFSVRYSNKNDTIAKRNPRISFFQTSAGIHLGLNETDFAYLLCKDFIKQKQYLHDSTIYLYEIVDTVNNFGHYNMPSYSARYVFVKNKLIQFSYGFDYP